MHFTALFIISCYNIVALCRNTTTTTLPPPTSQVTNTTHTPSPLTNDTPQPTIPQQKPEIPIHVKGTRALAAKYRNEIMLRSQKLQTKAREIEKKLEEYTQEDKTTNHISNAIGDLVHELKTEADETKNAAKKDSPSKLDEHVRAEEQVYLEEKLARLKKNRSKLDKLWWRLMMLQMQNGQDHSKNQERFRTGIESAYAERLQYWK